jgi:putative nucleotidyltransferase with HDIG domain
MTATEPPSPDAEGPVTILLVEDDQAQREMVARFVRTLGHEVAEAGDAAGARALIQRRRTACVILDISLPGSSGLDLMPSILKYEPHAAVIMLSGNGDASMATRSLQLGAIDYLVKPVDLPDLERAITRALSHRREQIDQEETQAWLKSELVWRGRELQKERDRLEHISVATLEALVNALEAKDPYLRGHSTRIANLAAQIAAEMGLADDRVETVRTAGRLHDIGKIGIRESVIGKRGALTEEEYEHVKEHVTIGARILAPLTHLRDVIAAVRSHHERVDGNGYPDGLAGSAIPLGGRIIGAAEVYDALTTSRPYQERMEQEEAVRRMTDLVGTVLDADVVTALHHVVSAHHALVFLEEE